MAINDDETLLMYVEESRDHLADIENDLLIIEEGGSEIDEELVNKVFRAAHSIKGGASFMALNNIRDLAHSIENVLGMMRSREIVPNPEIVNILLLAFDKLRELINNFSRSEEMDISEHVLALSGLTAVALPEEEKECLSRTVDIVLPDGRRIFSVSEFDLLRAEKEGKFVYLVEYDLIHDVHNKGKTPLEVLRSMLDSGTILDSKVDVTAVGELEDELVSTRLPFLVLFATIIEPDIVGALCEVDSGCIHLIEKENILEAAPSASMDKERTIPPFPTPFTDLTFEDRSSPAPVAHANEISLPEPLLRSGPAPSAENTQSRRDGEAGGSSVEAYPKSVLTPAPDSSEARTGPRRDDPGGSEPTVRVHVRLLDSLMTLAGELVLGRNQLLQAMATQDGRSMQLASQKIKLVTSDLQDTIMSTRMQPVGNILNKFPRVVRDLARDLSKEVQLQLEGKEVELDRTILEGLNDPLTHLVRNAVDHGLESPSSRLELGKPPVGTVRIKAWHQAGLVNVEISDDGRGIDGNKVAATAVSRGLLREDQARTMSEKEKMGLIFLPGLSMAERVTDVSGRGVGMDVVKTNLDRLGGQVEIDSKPGKGTIIRVKLPLTLAIIPCLLVSAGGERFSIPQVNLDELLRIPAAQVKERVELVGDAEVVRLRGKLLPVVRLTDLLGMERSYTDPVSGGEKNDRRQKIADRRSRSSSLFSINQSIAQPEAKETEVAEGADSHRPSSIAPAVNDALPLSLERRSKSDRRYHATGALNIAVVSAGPLKYGLVVDALHDSEEIVVKPLGRHLKQCRGYAGATILGDGRVTLILDVGNLARMAGLTSLEGTARSAEVAGESTRMKQNHLSLLVFRNAPDEQFAVPLGLVARIEKITAEAIETVGGRRVMHYRGGTLPLFSIDEAASVKPMGEMEKLLVIVFSLSGREAGLLATGPVDALETAAEVDSVTLREPGIMGSAVMRGQTTLLVDVYELIEKLHPQMLSEGKDVRRSSGEKTATILLAEDSSFFRGQVKKFMEGEGYRVIEAQDGAIAWELLQKHGEVVSLLVTDIEMPNMDGYSLTRKIRKDDRFTHLPVIAVTSLAGEEDMAKGKDAGIDDYQIKLDRERVLESITTLLDIRK